MIPFAVLHLIERAMNSDLITALCGMIIGVALGLTGGGGSIFAVPLLIYALGVDVRTAGGSGRYFCNR